MLYEYLKDMVNHYTNLGFENYLIYYNDLLLDDFDRTLEKSKITCYFAKSPILQNADYTFTVEEECQIVTLDYNIITNIVIRRQDTSLLLEEFEEIIVPNSSYIYTNAEIQTTSGLSVNIYPSFYFSNNLQTNDNLNFTNFMLVLLYVTLFICLVFRKFIFGG